MLFVDPNALRAYAITLGELYNAIAAESARCVRQKGRVSRRRARRLLLTTRHARIEFIKSVDSRPRALLWRSRTNGLTLNGQMMKTIAPGHLILD